MSTDEIYGEIYKSSFKENSKFNPSNPYSSSKAAAEMIINGYIHSYNLPIIIIRSNNIFGIRQHPEKLIAGCCWTFIKKEISNTWIWKAEKIIFIRRRFLQRNC